MTKTISLMVQSKQHRRRNRKLKNQTKKVRLRCHAAARESIAIIDSMQISDKLKEDLKGVMTPYLKNK